MRKKRINSRITEEVNLYIKELSLAQDKTISEIISESITSYYKNNKPQKNKPWLTLAKSGFIGCVSGARKLPKNYKKDIIKRIEEQNIKDYYV